MFYRIAPLDSFLSLVHQRERKKEFFLISFFLLLSSKLFVDVLAAKGQ
jgi:hypothetical protein